MDVLPAVHVLETLAQPLTDPASRTFAPWLAVFAVLALAFYRAPTGQKGWPWLRDALGLSLWVHPSARADLYLLPANCLRPWDELFLDDLSLDNLRTALDRPILPIDGDCRDLVTAALK